VLEKRVIVLCVRVCACVCVCVCAPHLHQAYQRCHVAMRKILHGGSFCGKFFLTSFAVMLCGSLVCCVAYMFVTVDISSNICKIRQYFL